MASSFVRTAAAVLLAVLAWPTAVAAQRRISPPPAEAIIGLLGASQTGTIKIYEATFKKFAAAIQPIQFGIPYDLNVTIPNPFGDDPTITLCSDTMSASVSSLDVDMTAYGITITGKANGSWCRLSFSNIGVTIGADVTYDAAARVIRVVTRNAVVSPRVGFDVPDWVPDWAGLPSRIDVALPSFSVGASFAVPPIALDTAPFMVETAAGPRHLLLSGTNVQLIRQDGYIEIRGNAVIR